MTNEQIVAELGWTRKAIKAILGVTPILMRPSYGDIDQLLFNFYFYFLNLFCLLTFSVWRVASGSISGNQSVQSFEQILSNATSLDTEYMYI